MPSSRGAAGERVQGGVKGYNERFSEKAGKLYTDAFSQIDAQMAGKTQPGASRIRATNTSVVLDSIVNGPQSQAVRDLVADPTVQKFAASLSDARKAADMSFADLRSMRTWVRTAQKNPELRQTIVELDSI